jgi:inorganic triphosphatase YgiF
METELKFQVPRAQRQALHRAMATASATTTRLQAVYADTPGQQLAAAGLALRLRKEGPVWVQTLKGRGDGLMQRLEHEVPLPAQRGVPTLNPQRHAGSPAGERLLLVLAAGGPLQPVYRTDIRRLHRRVRQDGALIELAYDRGRIFVGEQSVVVDEIEFELVRGPAAALPELAARWALRFGLWWDVRTKSERGFRLALGRTTVSPAMADAAIQTRGLISVQAWQARLQAALLVTLPNAAELAAGTGGAGHLVQWRLALQQLCGVLGAAPAAFPQQAVAKTLGLALAEQSQRMQPAAAPRAFARVPAAPLAAAGRAARSTPLCLLMLRSLALSVPMAPQRNGTP